MGTMLRSSFCARLDARSSTCRSVEVSKAHGSKAERELRRIGAAILAAVDAGDTELHVDRGELRPPPIRIEVTAAQQRVLGQVQPLPELPALAAVFAQLKATQPADASKLERIAIACSRLRGASPQNRWFIR